MTGHCRGKHGSGHVTVFNTGWHGCDWLSAITDPTCGPENRVVNMENISKSTQIQPKRAIMAYGLPMQVSGALGPTNTIKSHLGSDFFWCWSHVVFANTADSGIAPRKWPGVKKRNFARHGPERTYLLVSVGFIRTRQCCAHYCITFVLHVE